MISTSTLECMAIDLIELKNFDGHQSSTDLIWA